MNTKHTPGPWKEVLNPESRLSKFITQDIPGSTCLTIAEVFMDLSSSEANAQLITAAPTLLEALRGLVHAEKRFSKESGMNLDDPIVKAVYVAEKAIQQAESTDKATI